MANFPVTISGSRVSPLILPEKGGRYTVRYLVPYTDLTATGSTGTSDTITLTLGTTPTTWLVDSAYVDITTAFVATGSGTLTMAVGTTSSLTAFVNTTSILSAGVIQSTYGPNSVYSPSNSTGTAAVNIVATFTNGAVPGISLISAGALTIVLGVHDPAAMS